MLCCVLIPHSFLWLNNIPLYGQTTVYLGVRSEVWVDSTLSVSIQVATFMWTSTFLLKLHLHLRFHFHFLSLGVDWWQYVASEGPTAPLFSPSVLRIPLLAPPPHVFSVLWVTIIPDEG